MLQEIVFLVAGTSSIVMGIYIVIKSFQHFMQSQYRWFFLGFCVGIALMTCGLYAIKLILVL